MGWKKPPNCNPNKIIRKPNPWKHGQVWTVWWVWVGIATSSNESDPLLPIYSYLNLGFKLRNKMNHPSILAEENIYVTHHSSLMPLTTTNLSTPDYNHHLSTIHHISITHLQSYYDPTNHIWTKPNVPSNMQFMNKYASQIILGSRKRKDQRLIKLLRNCSAFFSNTIQCCWK